MGKATIKLNVIVKQIVELIDSIDIAIELSESSERDDYSRTLIMSHINKMLDAELDEMKHSREMR